MIIIVLTLCFFDSFCFYLSPFYTKNCHILVIWKSSNKISFSDLNPHGYALSITVNGKTS
jgi:hypothetical protein